MDSKEIRNSVKRCYDLVAEQYGRNYIEDLDIYDKFEKLLPRMLLF